MHWRGLWTSRLVRLTAYLLVAVTGLLLGVQLMGRQEARVGPVDVRLQLAAGAGGTTIALPPLGTIALATHRGPLALRASVLDLRADVAGRIARDPTAVGRLGDRVADDLRSAAQALIARTLVAGFLGCGLLALLVFRSLRRTAYCLAISTLALSGVAVTTVATWRPQSVREPRFTGLLTSAPAAIGRGQDIAANFTEYRAALGQLVGNVVQLYDVTSTLSTYRPNEATIAVLHVSDLHLNPAGTDLVVQVAQQFHVRAVVDSGDLTDHGSAAEAPFVDDLARLPVPYVYVRGNHDSAETVAQVRRLPRAVVLDNQVTTVAGLTVAGIADPRFTPDRSRPDGDPAAELTTAGERLRQTIDSTSGGVDIALVHDPDAAAPLNGAVPLVLSGHRHARRASMADGTLTLVEGSTGGAGLRGLEGAEPTPLECSVLYFDATSHRLRAWDEITLGGLGATSVTVERHLARDTTAYPSAAPDASPS